MNNRKKIKTISCNEALEKMFEYIDGALAGKSHSELEQHIETCKGCLKKLDFQLKLKKRLTKVKPESVSKGLAKRLNNILNSYSV
jgi:mycothiol system anti-sigma-R factor